MQRLTIASRVVALAMTLSVAAGIAACGSEDRSTTGDTSAATGTGDAEQYTVGWVPPTVAPFEAALRAGLKLQAQSLGMDVVVAGGKFDPNVQISAVDSLVQRDVDAIVIWPLDEKSIQPALDRARDKGIPIVTINAPGDGAEVNFQTNDEASAEQMAEYAASAIGNDCRVGIIEGVSVVPSLKQRNEGYAKGATAAGCEILDRQTNTDDTPQKAGEIASAWKTSFGGEMTGILAINDPSALAATAQASGDFTPLVFGANGDAEAIEAVRQGRLAGTQAAPSPMIGNGAAYAAHQLLTGGDVPETVEVRYVQVTERNVGEYPSYAEQLKGPMKISFADGVLTAGGE
jgi:ribose transport system substrate-binding protein